MAKTVSKLNQRPTGDQVRRLRESIAFGAGVREQREQFGAPLGTPWERIKAYEIGVREAPAEWWTLARITWDPLFRAQWLKALPKRNGDA